MRITSKDQVQPITFTIGEETQAQIQAALAASKRVWVFRTSQEIFDAVVYDPEELAYYGEWILEDMRRQCSSILQHVGYVVWVCGKGPGSGFETYALPRIGRASTDPIPHH